MRYLFSIITLLLCFYSINAQEFKCQVRVDASKIQTSEKKIFENMEQSLNDFVNSRKFTTIDFKPEERINCNISLMIKSQSARTNFVAQLNVQCSRPVYNSNYSTGLLNYVENDFQFTFDDNQPIEFDVNTYYSNLTSAVGYYLYVMLGLTFDSSSPYGGEPFFETARNIAQTASRVMTKGWASGDGSSSRDRYWIAENYRNSIYRDLRLANYTYNRMGLDMMTINQPKARKAIIESLELLQKVYENRSSNYLALTLFVDTKVDEIINIFTPAPEEEKKQVVEIIRVISPTQVNKFKGMDALMGR